MIDNNLLVPVQLTVTEKSLHTTVYFFFLIISGFKYKIRFCLQIFLVVTTTLVFHTTYVVCVNFYTLYKWRDLQFKVDSERQIFLEKLFMAIFFTLRVFVRNLLSGKNTFRILF